MSMKRGKIGPRSLLMTNRKLHTRCRLVPKSMTLDDLYIEQPFRTFRTLFQNACDFGAYHENFNEGRPILLAKRCSAMTVVHGNIRFMRTFATREGFLEMRRGNRKRRFSGLSEATSSASQEMRPTLLHILFSPL